MQSKHLMRVLALGLLAGAAQTASAQAGSWTVSTGYNFSTGNYGTTSTTDITSIPFSLAYETGPWNLKVTVPYLRISGPADVVAGVGRGRRSTRGVPVTTTTMRTSSGLGDVVAAATYNFYNDAASQMGADITGKVKFGTASSDNGLGTGKNDYTVLLDLYKKLNSQWSLFGGIGYSVLGSSADVPLNNVASLSLGASYKISDQTSSGLSWDLRERSSATSYSQSELTGFLSHKFTKQWKTQLYVLKGFSDGSPDWGAGATLSYGF
jgi:hypothetical protein